MLKPTTNALILSADGVADLRAALAELKQLRAERIADAHAVAKVIAATNRHARGDSLTQLHQAIDALEERFDDCWELLEDDEAPQQPERGGEATCGPACSEMHTYEPGQCEAAVLGAEDDDCPWCKAKRTH